MHLAAKVSLAGHEDEFRAVNVAGTRRLSTPLNAREYPVRAGFVAVGGVCGRGARGCGRRTRRPSSCSGQLRAHESSRGADCSRARFILHARGGCSSPHRVGPGRYPARRPHCGTCSTGQAPAPQRWNSSHRHHLRRQCCDRHRLPPSPAHPRRTGEHLSSPTASRDPWLTSSRASVSRLAYVRHVGAFPASLGRTAGSIIEQIWAVTGRTDEPPMTRFLAEQLSTAHWFDQRETRRALDWSPAVSIDEGLRRLECQLRG